MTCPSRTAASLNRYVGPVGAQVHISEMGDRTTGPPLYCLHATAYSGRAFLPFMRALADRRRVAAPDTPGYGASDRPDRRLDIPGYARALEDTLEAAGETRVDLLGYHTGAFVAAQLARQRPDLVRRLVLIGVPLFFGAEREARRDTLAAPMTLTEALEQFAERWAFFITDRHRGQSLARGFDNFVDELRAWPFGFWAHEAAFTFDAEACLARVEQPVLILNPDNHLAEPSRRAAELLPTARVVELPHLNSAIFDIAPDELADRVDGFLSEA
jgi:pimeloyl-ACP methyl ester carboxylesterase